MVAALWLVPKVIEEPAIVGVEFVQAMTSLDAYRVDGRSPGPLSFPPTLIRCAVLALAHHEDLAVVPWGGGTTMAMGHPPEA